VNVHTTYKYLFKQKFIKRHEHTCLYPRKNL